MNRRSFLAALFVAPIAALFASLAACNSTVAPTTTGKLKGRNGAVVDLTAGTITIPSA